MSWAPGRVRVPFRLARALPDPILGNGKGTLTAQIEQFGSKLLPIPRFWAACQPMHWGDGKGNAAFTDFDHVNEWLPEDSPIRARKIGGRVCTIRAAYRLASSARGEPTANAGGAQREQVVAKMRWYWRGADLVLQVRCPVYNGTLGSGFGQLFAPIVRPDVTGKIAA